MQQHPSALWPGSVNLDMQPEDMDPTVVLTEHTSVKRGFYHVQPHLKTNMCK